MVWWKKSQPDESIFDVLDKSLNRDRLNHVGSSAIAETQNSTSQQLEMMTLDELRSFAACIQRRHQRLKQKFALQIKHNVLQRKEIETLERQRESTLEQFRQQKLREKSDQAQRDNVKIQLKRLSERIHELEMELLQAKRKN